MVVVENANDFEMYSATSAGGFQGNGYQCRNAGPRFLRIVKSNSWSVHDLVFVDSPEFHLIIDNSNRGEVFDCAIGLFQGLNSTMQIYNLAIRGADIGGSDGVDVTGTNVWVCPSLPPHRAWAHVMYRFMMWRSQTATSA
jgi:rhamnogalacturonan hydrolase